MVSVPGHAEPDDLCQDLGSSCTCKLEFLQDHNSGTFPHDKPIPAHVKGAAGELWFVVAGRKRFHGVKAGERQGRNGSFSTAGNGCISVAILDHPESVADTMRSGSTCCNHTGVGTFGARDDGDVT